MKIKNFIKQLAFVTLAMLCCHLARAANNLTVHDAYQIAVSQISEPDVGDVSVELNLPATDGLMISISSMLTGETVLLDRIPEGESSYTNTETYISPGLYVLNLLDRGVIIDNVKLTVN